MSADKNQPMSDEQISMIKAMTELQVNSRLIAEAVKKLEDVNEGTVERRGLKERIALAEENISAHKQAWIKNEQYLGQMEVRLLSQLDKKFESLSNAIESQKTFIDKIRPYMNVMMWAVSLIMGWLALQILGGNIQIVRVP